MSDSFPIFNGGFGRNDDHMGDPSDVLANIDKIFIEFYHIATGRSVAFKAFVTAFDDNYTSDWNQEEVYGRMDPVQTFKGTKRVISLGWDVVAASGEEAETNFEHCNELLSLLYPVYDQLDSKAGAASTIQAPPLFKLRFINLIQDSGAGAGGIATAKAAGLVGTANGFSYSPDLEAGFYQVGHGVMYPQTIKLSCEFTVAHTHALGFGPDNKKRTGFEGFPYQGAAVEPDDANEDAGSGGTDEMGLAGIFNVTGE
tara:strand:- start:779 stop:1546 length:768 start_codon:yes stop_codon:yes gene_type:complete